MPFVRSFQKVIVVGNVTRDPTLRYTPNNTAVARFTVATNRMFVNSAGERKEETQFHPIVVWGKFAEKIADVVKKGYKVYIEGRLEYREKRDDEGKLIAKDAQIRAETIVILQRSSKAPQQTPAGIQEQGEETTIDLDTIAEQLAEEEEAKEQTSQTNKKTSEETSSPEDELPF